MNDVDVVITWVDGNDPRWQREYNMYAPAENQDSRMIRYRDWNNLQYVFRGIEKYLSWIRDIYFVTWGHIPDWLNTSNKRLKVISHSDFIPDKYLPTFNINTIEMNFHRIEGLSEKFIYFNDDTFILGCVKEKEFFRRDLPIHIAALDAYSYKVQWNSYMGAADTAIINEHFEKYNAIKKNLLKWFSLKNGVWLYKTFSLLPYKYFTGLKHSHQPEPYLKETLRELWVKEYKILDETCSHKFRSSTDVNQWLIAYWEVVSGNFYPGNRGGKMVNIVNKSDALECCRKMSGKHRFYSINDYCGNDDFEVCKKLVNKKLQEKLPEKSSFEL